MKIRQLSALHHPSAIHQHYKINYQDIKHPVADIIISLLIYGAIAATAYLLIAMLDQ